VLNRKLDQLLQEPENSELLNDIGVLLFQLKDFENAEKYLKRSNDLSPCNPEILYNYALLLYHRYQLTNAVAAFNAYLRIDPNNTQVIEKLGDCYYRTGNFQLAAETYGLLQDLKGES
jgi:Flp pilus assembly protein TadD